MKTTRKLSALLLAVSMVLTAALTGCSKKEQPASPDLVAEAIFELIIQDNAAKAQTVLGYASEEEAREELIGSDGALYDEGGALYDDMAQQFLAQFQSAGVTVKEEDVKTLVDAIVIMLSKLTFTADVKEMDEDAGTAVVTGHITYVDADALNAAMEASMTEIMNDPELLNDVDALFTALFQAMADAMIQVEPVQDTRDFDSDFELVMTEIAGKTKFVWLPVDAEQFGYDLSTAAMG